MKAARFFRFFPPPVYMTMPHSGISLSDDGIRTIGFNQKHGHLHLSHFSYEQLPPGVIVGGKVEKLDELIVALKKVKARHNIEFVTTSIPDEKAYIFKTTVPRQEGINMADVLAFKIQETVPISGPDAVFDFVLVNQTPESVDAVVRVVHQKVLSVYLNAFQAAGMYPLSFKVQSQAIADAVLGVHDNDPTVVMYMEATKTTCMIVRNHAVEFSMVIDIGSITFMNALQKSLSISEEVAARIVTGEDPEGVSHEDIVLSTALVMSVIRDEVVKLQEYWKEKDEKKPINSLVIGGLSASMNGFAQYLDQGTGLHTSIMNVWENALSLNHQVPAIPFAEASSYAPTVGLALPGPLHF